MNFCPCCRTDMNGEKIGGKLFSGKLERSEGFPRMGDHFVGVPVCQKCFDAAENMQRRVDAGEIKEVEYSIYSEYLQQRIQRGMLLNLFVYDKEAGKDIRQLCLLE